MRIASAVVTVLGICHLPACASSADPETGVPGSGLATDNDGGGGDDGKADSSLGARVCPGASTVLGIDVSYYQGVVNWPKVKAAGVGFAVIRVADGANFKDPKFATNWAGTQAAGIIRGGYQFFRPEQDPMAQAKIMIDAIGTYQDGDLPPTIDVEISDGIAPAKLAANLGIYIDAIEDGLGVEPIVYTGSYFWRDNVGAPTTWSDAPMWIAAYGPTCPTILNAWTNWQFWQYSGSGTMAGVASAVDLDHFNGTLEDLNTFVNSQ